LSVSEPTTAAPPDDEGSVASGLEKLSLLKEYGLIAVDTTWGIHVHLPVVLVLIGDWPWTFYDAMDASADDEGSAASG
jgi:hypothetical protein